MPVYEYRCAECGQITTRFESIHSNRKTVKCDKCGKKAVRIVSLPNTDLKENIRFSVSMGVDPSQIENAERAWPGSKYDKQGRLIIRNRKEKLERLRQRHYQEND